MEPLLKFSSLGPETPAEPKNRPDVHGMSVPGSGSFLIGKHGDKLRSVCPELLPDHTYMYFTRGAWSMHQMVRHVVDLIGPCDAWLTSWGISQEPLNEILEMHRVGRIRSLRCLFDSRIREECPQAHQLTLLSNAIVRLGKNHSKVVILMNSSHAITISASANLTNNPRMESYVMMTHRHIANEASSMIDQVIEGAQPFNAL